MNAGPRRGRGQGDVRGERTEPGRPGGPGRAPSHGAGSANVVIQPMCVADLTAVLALWRGTEGLGLGASDEPEALGRFLERNPGLSLVARAGDALVGAVLTGHDGRRGYLHHLAVADAYRRAGTGRALVERACAQLARLGLEKCHVFVYPDNEAGRRFWTSLGYRARADLTIMSRTLR